MRFTLNESTEKISVLKSFFSQKLLMFVSAYIIRLALLGIQLYAGEFVLQGTGDFDNITSYDYIIPVINSAVTVITLAAFCFMGYLAYGKDKLKIFRFPMAYCFSAAFAAFISDFFIATYNSPLMDSFNVGYGTVDVVVAVLQFASAVLFFFYFDHEKEKDMYSDDKYSIENPTVRRTLRGKMLSHRLSVLWIVLAVSEGAGVISSLIRSGLTALFVILPENYYWTGGYIETVAVAVQYAAYFLFAVYLLRDVKLSARFIGIILFVSTAMDGFSFVINSITNVFSQAGEHWLNSVFSTIFVVIISFVFSVVKLLILVFLCRKLKKLTETDYT